MRIEQAQKIADKYVRLLSPYCKRIEIAGSIRRKKAEVGDIEIVCIRNTKYLAGFVMEVNKLKKIKGSPLGRYTQRELPEEIVLDLFMCRPENWGLMFAIRTGSAEFSHHTLGRAWVRAGYKCDDGMLFKDQRHIPVYEEEDLFKLLGINYIQPEFRIG